MKKQKKFKKVIESPIGREFSGAMIVLFVLFMAGFLSGSDGLQTKWYMWAWFPILEIITAIAIHFLGREVYWEEVKE